MTFDDASDEEAEELFAEQGKPASTTTRESKRDREDKLKQMMEDDDGMPLSRAFEPH